MELGVNEHYKRTSNDININYCLLKMYLSRRCDNILSVRFTLQGLCQLAEQINTHFNGIKLVFAFCSRGGGGDKQCWQGSSHSTDHCQRRKSRSCGVTSIWGILNRQRTNYWPWTSNSRVSSFTPSSTELLCLESKNSFVRVAPHGD